MKERKTRAVTEFGDFQTPTQLALAATQILARLGIQPHSILEPTCGRGAFISAASNIFPEAESIIGFDINREYLTESAKLVDTRIRLQHGNFFKVAWDDIVTKNLAPWLILGNPPWVTSADLGTLESDNLPEKSNFHGRHGIEAITGKSNFDISEWMLLRYIEWLKDGVGTIAVLCKTAVARKILLSVWKSKIPVHSARIYKIDALNHFGASVDACFFVIEIRPSGCVTSCDIFNALSDETPSQTLGYLDNHIIFDIGLFNQHRSLLGADKHYIWRSGIKHDCSKVMELAVTQDGYQNGLGETVSIEDTMLFPMLKSSDIGNGRIHCRSSMLVTQQTVGEDTAYIQTEAPQTWEYLKHHAHLLDKRGSVIYKKKPAFSVFGVGSYSFAPWKIAISGFYKKLNFVKVNPVNNRPVVFDDTVYFLPCWSEDEAYFLESLLSSDAAKNFFLSMIHWDEKRPITVEILKRLSISKLASMLGFEREYTFFTKPKELPLFAVPYSGKENRALIYRSDGGTVAKTLSF